MSKYRLARFYGPLCTSYSAIQRLAASVFKSFPPLLCTTIGGLCRLPHPTAAPWLQAVRTVIQTYSGETKTL